MSQNVSARKREILTRVAASRLGVIDEMDALAQNVRRKLSWVPRLPGLSQGTSTVAWGAVTIGGLWGWWRHRRRAKRDARRDRQASCAPPTGVGSPRGFLAESLIVFALPFARDYLMKRFGLTK